MAKIVAKLLDVISGRNVTVTSNGPVCYPSIYVSRDYYTRFKKMRKTKNGRRSNKI